MRFQAFIRSCFGDYDFYTFPENQLDLVGYEPIAEIDRTHDDTMDMRPIPLRILSLFQRELDKISVKCHDRLSETNDVVHDDQNGLKPKNEFSEDLCCP